MNHTEPLLQAAKRPAMAKILLVLLGAAGCMSRPRVVMSTADAIASTSGPSIVQAQGECIAFTCAVVRATLNPRQD